MTTSSRSAGADVRRPARSRTPTRRCARQQREALAEVVDGRPGFWQAHRLHAERLPVRGRRARRAAAAARCMDERTFFGWAFALTVTAAYVMYAASWDILSGFTGQVNFGQSAFIGTGGIVAAIVAGRPLRPAAVRRRARRRRSSSALLGVVVGVPALRLTGPYLALVTLTVVTALVNLVAGAQGVHRWGGGRQPGSTGSSTTRCSGRSDGGSRRSCSAAPTPRPARLDQDSYVDYVLLVFFALVVVAGLLVLGYSKPRAGAALDPAGRDGGRGRGRRRGALQGRRLRALRGAGRLRRRADRRSARDGEPGPAGRHPEPADHRHGRGGRGRDGRGAGARCPRGRGAGPEAAVRRPTFITQTTRSSSSGSSRSRSSSSSSCSRAACCRRCRTCGAAGCASATAGRWPPGSQALMAAAAAGSRRRGRGGDVDEGSTWQAPGPGRRRAARRPRATTAAGPEAHVAEALLEAKGRQPGPSAG